MATTADPDDSYPEQNPKVQPRDGHATQRHKARPSHLPRTTGEAEAGPRVASVASFVVWQGLPAPVWYFWVCEFLLSPL